MISEEIVIRRYIPQDREAVQEIAWETAFMGKPASAFFDDKRLLADFLTASFIDHEPQSCFVAVSGSQVVGYLIGTRDSHSLQSIFLRRVLPGLIARLLTPPVMLSRKNRVFLWRCLRSFLRGEFAMEDLDQEYPAVLHINLREGFRHAGIGARLMQAFLDYVRNGAAIGVRLATMSEEAGSFFKTQGFVLRSRHARSYFRHIVGKDIWVSVYCLKL